MDCSTDGECERRIKEEQRIGKEKKSHTKIPASRDKVGEAQSEIV